MLEGSSSQEAAPAPPIPGLSLIIPVYNDSNGLDLTLKELGPILEKFPIEADVIVVDDGSDPAVQAAGIPLPVKVRLVRHPVNLGYGAAVKTGIREAKYNHVALMDGDASYPAAEILNLLSHLDTSAMIVGERETIPYPSHRWAKAGARLLLKAFICLILGRRVPDINSGLRVFCKDKMSAWIHELSNGFSFTTGLTLLMHFYGHKVSYQRIRYQHRVGDSKVHYLKDGLRVAKMVVRLTSRHKPSRLLRPLGVLAGAGALLTLILS